MSLADLNARHLRLVAGYSARYSLRAGSGIVYMILIVICGLAISAQLIDGVVFRVKEESRRQSGREISNEEILRLLVNEVSGVADWYLQEDTPEGDLEAEREAKERASEWSEFLLRKRPALLSVIFLVPPSRAT